jgi:hypothetical protein
VALDTRWENVDALLKRTERTIDETLARAVREIADQRFAFPSEAFPAYRTHVNVPEVAMGVQIGDAGAEVVPSIVVVERIKTGESRLVMTAHVCVREQVNESEAKRLWAPLASIPDAAFYLYVPVGYGLVAKRVCKQAGVRVDGYRTWRNTPRGFEVNDVG